MATRPIATATDQSTWACLKLPDQSIALIVMKTDYILPGVIALAVLTIVAGRIAAQDKELQARCLQQGSAPAECSLRLYGR